MKQRERLELWKLSEGFVPGVVQRGLIGGRVIGLREPGEQQQVRIVDRLAADAELFETRALAEQFEIVGREVGRFDAELRDDAVGHIDRGAELFKLSFELVGGWRGM